MNSLDRTELVVVNDCTISDDVTFRPFVNLYKSTIGKGTRIAAFVEIGGAKIGQRCSVQAFAYICPGVIIGDDVLISPHVCFVNHNYPTAVADWDGMEKTVVEDGAVIGARAIILAGVRIGRGAFIGAGSVVTKNVPAGETWVGNPARNINDPGESGPPGPPGKDKPSKDKG